MSFAKGFATGLSKAFGEELNQAEKENNQKRQYYRQLMFENAIPAYFQKKQKAQQYKTLAEQMRGQYQDATEGQLKSIVNRAQGDPEMAHKLAAKADFSKRRSEIDQQVSQLRERREQNQSAQNEVTRMPSMEVPQSTTEGNQQPSAGQVPQQSQGGSVSFSDRSGGDQKFSDWFSSNVLGKDTDQEIRDDVARGIAADLGMDEESFSGIMKEAFTGYSGLEGGEYVHYPRSLTSGQQSVMDGLMSRYEAGDSGMSEDQERKFLMAVAQDDVPSALQYADFLSEEDKERIKAQYDDEGSGSADIDMTDWRSWQDDAASVTEKRFGQLGVDGNFVFLEDMNEQDLSTAVQYARDDILRQRQQNPNQPPSTRAAASRAIGYVAANDIRIKLENAEKLNDGRLKTEDGTFDSREDLIEHYAQNQRDPLAQAATMNFLNYNQEEEEQKSEEEQSDQSGTEESGSSEQEYPTISTQEDFDALEDGALYYERDENGNIVTDENGQPEVFRK